MINRFSQFKKIFFRYVRCPLFESVKFKGVSSNNDCNRPLLSCFSALLVCFDDDFRDLLLFFRSPGAADGVVDLVSPVKETFIVWKNQIKIFEKLYFAVGCFFQPNVYWDHFRHQCPFLLQQPSL